MLNIFIPRELTEGETRVAATPDTVRNMVKRLGLAVSVEAGAGTLSGLSDDQFKEAGATVATDAEAAFGAADIVLKMNAAEDRDGKSEVDMMKEGGVLASFVYPLINLDLVKRMKARKITSFAMDLVPRITRAQKMDALSSQSNIAGYKCVIIAADVLMKMFPMMMTAAGTIKPARIVIIGAGVAGLQAIATAKRLGAIVEVNDIRPAVKEQVESLGGRFIELPQPDESAEDKGGYAKEMDEDFLKKQREVLTKHISEADAVITTALIPGRPAPKLVTEEMVAAMKPGSVVVDLAAVMGGNCPLTVAGERIVTDGGVTIVGETNVAGMVPFHASQMYAKNVFEVVRHLVTKEGELELDFEDEITAGSVVTSGGKIYHGPTAEALGEKVPEPEPEPEPENEEGGESAGSD